jgi:hypothetical protein
MVFETIFDFDSFCVHYFLNTSTFDGTTFCGAASFFAESALFQAANMDSQE